MIIFLLAVQAQVVLSSVEAQVVLLTVEAKFFLLAVGAQDFLLAVEAQDFLLSLEQVLFDPTVYNSIIVGNWKVVQYAGIENWGQSAKNFN